MEKIKEQKKQEMTVDQVKSAANEQIGILYQKLQEANLANVFKRLDYLCRIVEGNNYLDSLRSKAQSEIDRIVFGGESEEEHSGKEE